MKVIDTDTKKKDGQNKCPKCGSSDITYNIKKEKLICSYCYTEFDKEEIDDIKEAKDLNEEVRGSGTKDISSNNDMITIKCDGCGAEIVINTNEATNSRCHWCRSVLSINHQIDNGAIPDVVLPFKISREDAVNEINKYVGKRKFFADKKFKKEFNTNNVMGVFFPYMLVDAKGHGKYIGIGEHEVRSYTVTKKVKHFDKEEEERETHYDYDVYSIEREFDIAIDDLAVETNIDILNKNNSSRTNNIINSVMPFDTEECVKYKGNYLSGYSSEKRNLNISNIENKVDKELKDITRHALNKEIKFYDRGVKWEEENLDFKGKQWISAYLPIWLYSYQDKDVLRYVAVNGRTGNTMGSIPLNKLKLFLFSILFFIVPLLLAILLSQYSGIRFIVGLIGFIVFLTIYFSNSSDYGNKHVRNRYEHNTKNELTNVKTNDKLIRNIYDSTNWSMLGANNNKIEGENVKVNKNVE